MRLFVRWIGALGAVLLGLTMLPTTAVAAQDPPVPTLEKPRSGVTIDQPVFEWQVPVDKREAVAYYEIEVALDDQFVTIVDPPKGASPDVPAPIAVYGTRYVPTRSYQAKTMYWHVRAVGTDGTKGVWSPTAVFVRRWTSSDEPAGTEVSVASSRVEDVRIVGGGSPPINNLAITWHPVAGAAQYEVQVSVASNFPKNEEATAECITPHTVLTPHMSGVYISRPTADVCDINTPIQPWIGSDWSRSQPGVTKIEGAGVEVGDSVVVRYPPDKTGETLPVLTVAEGSFSVADTNTPAGESSGTVEWYKKTLNIEPGEEYFVRVRAIDLTTSPDYPGQVRVDGMWSDHRRELGDPPPPLVRFTPTRPSGTGSLSDPGLPLDPAVTSTDIPMLAWRPAPDAELYRVVIALDQDFTDIVGIYQTRSAQFIPANTFDDNGSGSTSYYWYALPCVLDPDQLPICLPDRDAINQASYVARFDKYSNPLKVLTHELLDLGQHALLRWEDALTAAGASTSGGASRYQVQITTTKDWATAPIITTDNLAYATTLNPAMPGGTYYWRVRTLDGDGAGLAWSEVKDFTLTGPPVVTPPTPTVSPNPTTEPTLKPEIPNPTPSANYDINPGAGGGTGNVVPTRPGKPAVTKVAKRTIRVRWNASTAFSDPVSGYLLFRSINGSDFSLVTQTSARKVRMRAKPGVTYRFYVVANSAAGKSRASATRTFRMR